jgi:hypothetical protein
MIDVCASFQPVSGVQLIPCQNALVFAFASMRICFSTKILTFIDSNCCWSWVFEVVLYPGQTNSGSLAFL